MITSVIAAAGVLYTLKVANEIMLRHIFPEDDFLPQAPPNAPASDHQP